ncbi:hypothetical protein [Bacillus massilinigeriensis]|uniref:hypothetical protein n=1 Tax=Bacillus massilionigeriensis TaxID=1805475 RepID=UPI00096B683A|nr:hypothetical protein [Bacillus massilionigeriensis]
MKKKVIIATVLSAVLIGGASITIYANNDGYHLYKDAAIKTHTIKSTNMSVEAKVIDNGMVLNEVQMDTKYNLQQEKMQSKVEVDMNGVKESFEMAYQDKGILVKNINQDSYYLLKDNESQEEKQEKFKAHHNPELMKIMGHVFDTLTVQVHDEFKVSKLAGGKKEISVNMTNGDIPVVFREIGQYMVKKSTGIHENVTMKTAEYPFLTQDLTADIPALVSDIQIEKVKTNAQLTSDNIIENQRMYIVISGKDKNGKSHKLELYLTIENSKINSTNLDSVELDDNKIEMLDSSKYKEVHHF